MGKKKKKSKATEIIIPAKDRWLPNQMPKAWTQKDGKRDVSKNGCRKYNHRFDQDN